MRTRFLAALALLLSPLCMPAQSRPGAPGPSTSITTSTRGGVVYHTEYRGELGKWWQNSEIAKNLKGHLMLITGDIDNNVHPSNTYRLADALIKANKRFDMLVLPGQRHGYTTAAEFVVWQRADYFAKHLLGDYDQSVDIWEINRERQQADKTQPGAAGRGGQTTTQQQNGRGGRRGGE